MQQWGVGQAQVLWNLRQNPKVVSVFSKLWNVEPEELLVSFSGFSFSFPHEVTKMGMFQEGKEMYHIDQRPGAAEFQCVQSWVTAYDVNPGDATLSVLQGSHTLLGDFAERFGKTKITREFVPLKEEELAWYQSQGCIPHDIACQAGSMVFWDSRTVHYGKSSRKERKRRNFRAVATLC